MSGRITSSMLSSDYLRNVRRNMSNMKTLQNQLSTGQEIQKVSDNPYKASRIMQINTEMTYNKQYNDNIKEASNWLDNTDTALGQMGNIFGRVETLLVSAGNGAYGPDQRAAIQDEVKEKVNELSQVLNTNFDGSYIFGGTKTDSKPTTAVNGVLQYADKDGNGIGTTCNIGLYKTVPGGAITTNAASPNTPYSQLTAGDITSLNTELTSAVDPRKTEINTILSSVPLNQINSDLEVDISQGVKNNYNKSAADVMEFTDKDGTKMNTSDILKKIIDDLGTGSTDLTTTDLKNIQAVTTNLLAQRSEVGAMQNRMDSAQSNNETENFNMTDVLSKTGDIDWAEKTMDMSMMQTVYTASLQTSAKILPMTILNYL